MDDERRPEGSGAYEWDVLVDEDQEEPPEEFANPAGIGRGACDSEDAEKDESCALESTAGIEDMVLEETKPGFGIAGFEGEEDGGG